jgi:hypothetical protein
MSSASYKALCFIPTPSQCSGAMRILSCTFFLLFLPVTLANLSPLSDPVCAHGNIPLENHYLGNPSDLVEIFGDFRMIARTINDICLGFNPELPNARCTCDKLTYETTCPGASTWTLDQWQIIAEQLCQKVCTCDPKFYKDYTDDEQDMESLKATSDTGLMDPSERKSFLDWTLRDVGRYLRGKCRWRCTGPQNCRQAHKACRRTPTTCKVHRKANGASFSSGLCVPRTMSIFEASAYKGLMPREDSETPPAIALESCACNQTYVSHACCESTDGVIWEEPHRKLGILEEKI